ncbi:hypothetical protein CK203_038186 [Vitis vinifera]|uniref:Uncharacterized protein n=1 Tax=Vitis vinifera TaxID=29760 RepID=A0A438IBU2_VITVI|nr:hypothetical protein CK203_038186 [Vitis vinifera]
MKQLFTQLKMYEWIPPPCQKTMMMIVMLDTLMILICLAEYEYCLLDLPFRRGLINYYDTITKQKKRKDAQDTDEKSLFCHFHGVSFW